MKQIKAMVVFAVFWGLAACSSGSQIKKDSFQPKVNEFLTAEFTDGLAEADKVLSFEVEGRQSDNPSNIGGYAIVRSGPELNKSQKQELGKRLVNENTYDFTSAKRCAFTPSVALRFTSKNANTDILLCFACKEIMFLRPSGNKTEDFDKEETYFTSLVTQLFPDHFKGGSK